jgi:hypothetical protein
MHAPLLQGACLTFSTRANVPWEEMEKKRKEKENVGMMGQTGQL